MNGLAPDTRPLSETSIVRFTDEYIYITYLVHHYIITYHNALHRVIANTTPHPVTLHHIVPGRYSHIYHIEYKFVNSKLYITSPYISHRVTLKHNLTYNNRSYQSITSHHTRDHTWLRTYPMSETPYQIEPESLNGNVIILSQSPTLVVLKMVISSISRAVSIENFIASCAESCLFNTLLHFDL